MKYEAFSLTGKMNVAKQVEQRVIDMLTEVLGIKGFKVDASVSARTNSFDINVKFESTPCSHPELEKYYVNPTGEPKYWCKECHQQMDVKEK